MPEWIRKPAVSYRHWSGKWERVEFNSQEAAIRYYNGLHVSKGGGFQSKDLYLDMGEATYQGEPCSDPTIWCPWCAKRVAPLGEWGEGIPAYCPLCHNELQY